MDKAFRLQSDPWPDAEPAMLSMGEGQLPARWVFRQEPNVIWSTVSMVRAFDALEEGTAGESIEIGISPDHMRMAAESLVEARLALERLDDIAEAGEQGDPQRWARSMSAALVSTERFTRQTMGSGQGRQEAADEADWAAGPVIRMIGGLLSDRETGALLEGLTPEEQGNLRLIMVQTMLRVGFAAADKAVPDGLADRIVTSMAQASGAGALEGELEGLLAEAIEQAPEAPEGDEVGAIVAGVLEGAPAVMRVAEVMLRQWDKVDAVTIEHRRLDEQSLVSITVKTLPGKQLELAGLVIMQPALTLEGTVRLTVLSDAPPAATSVIIEPAPGSEAMIRFSGLGWTLARLLAMPIADASIREVRVWRGTDNPQAGGFNVSLLMLAPGRGDQRRILTVHRLTRKMLLREPGRVGLVDAFSELDVSYLTPGKVYYYQRASDERVGEQRATGSANPSPQNVP
jgi:hypothetical protein